MKNTWNLAETAPKDRRILVYNINHDLMTVVKWWDNKGCSFINSYFKLEVSGDYAEDDDFIFDVWMECPVGKIKI